MVAAAGKRQHRGLSCGEDGRTQGVFVCQQKPAEQHRARILRKPSAEHRLLPLAACPPLFAAVALSLLLWLHHCAMRRQWVFMGELLYAFATLSRPLIKVTASTKRSALASA